MKLHSLPIFKSAIPVDDMHPCHFLVPETIQDALERVCEAWVRYLRDFVNQTSKLFQHPELPWRGTERAMVSSLAAAIIRGFPSSLVVEEGRVPRTRKAAWGRCDLWATIPDLTPNGTEFSFYLEAKKSDRVKTADVLSTFLTSSKGVSRLYRAHAKSQRNQISKLSPYAKLSNRIHNHYNIGMLVTQLKVKTVKRISPKIIQALREVFENPQPITKRKNADGEAQTRMRNLQQLPTVAIVVLNDEDHSGIVATLTVFGSTKAQLARS